MSSKDLGRYESQQETSGFSAQVADHSRERLHKFRGDLSILWSEW